MIPRLVVAIPLLIATAAGAADFHVSPTGAPQGDGSEAKPWDLATALSHPQPVAPGDTVWLHEGAYLGGFTCRLKGTEARPITVRQAKGERATIDCIATKERKDTLFAVMSESAHVVFRDFEVTCSDPKRLTEVKGSFPDDINRGGINCAGSHIKFVNMIVHDTGGAFGFWSDGEGGEIYGCVLYNNGWKGPDRGHGHGIYAQNQKGAKRLVDNIIFNQFGYGIHVYGSSKAFLQGFHIEGNVCFNNGSLAGENTRSANILVGGESPASRIAVLNNYTWHDMPDTSAQFGYAATNEDLVLKDNYFVGLTRIKGWKTTTITGNTFISADNPLETDAAAKPAPPANTVVKGKPGINAIFVRPNQYEPGRAHVVVYNWEQRQTLNLDLKGVLKPGQKFRILNAQDPLGGSLDEEARVYDGKPVTLQVRPMQAAKPIGQPQIKPPPPQPGFGVYIIVPE